MGAMSETLERVREVFAERYAVEREIGRGGMATVYLANDLKHGRQVALKVLRPELTSALGGDRFPREIQTVAQLSHPHIVPLHDSGELGGLLYYVMPYVEGQTLRQRLKDEGPLPVHEVVRVLRNVADALSYAHHRDVIHRDIKPENVMLSGRHALVTDFGVAKAVSQAGGEQLTTVGVALDLSLLDVPILAGNATNAGNNQQMASGVVSSSANTGMSAINQQAASIAAVGTVNIGQ